MNSGTRYSLTPERAALTLGAVAAALVLVHVAAMQAYFNPALGLDERFGLSYWQLAVFDLDEEESFGTWFSSGILFVAGVLLLNQAGALCPDRSSELRSAESSEHRWWFVLGLAFVFLSVDEVVGMHELMNTLMEENPWTVVGFPVLVLVGLSYLPFLWRYRGRTAVLFVVAGVIYGGGAVGVEHYTDADVNSLHYNMWTALEEGMEMYGVIVLIYAILDFMRQNPVPRVTLAVLPDGGAAG